MMMLSHTSTQVTGVCRCHAPMGPRTLRGQRCSPRILAYFGGRKSDRGRSCPRPSRIHDAARTAVACYRVREGSRDRERGHKRMRLLPSP